MKNKLIALFILIATITGLVVVFYIFASKEFPKKTDEPETSSRTKEEISLVPVNIPSNITEETSEENPEDEVENKYIKTYNIDGKKFFLDIKNTKLVLLSEKETPIGFFDFIDTNALTLKKIYNSNNYLLDNREKQFIISENQGALADINIKIPIKYVKEDGDYYIIITEKGPFLFNKKTKELSYSALFEDFVLFDKNSYIAPIDKKDYTRNNKFSLPDNGAYKIIFFSPITNQTRILSESYKKPQKIYKSGASIYIEIEDGSTFRLQNLTKENIIQE